MRLTAESGFSGNGLDVFELKNSIPELVDQVCGLVVFHFEFFSVLKFFLSVLD